MEGFSFIAVKLENIKSWDTPKDPSIPSETISGWDLAAWGESWNSILQNPPRLPSIAVESGFAVELVDGPVRLLALGAAVLQDVSMMQLVEKYLRPILTTTRRHLAQLDLPVF